MKNIINRVINYFKPQPKTQSLGEHLDEMLSEMGMPNINDPRLNEFSMDQVEDFQEHIDMKYKAMQEELIMNFVESMIHGYTEENPLILTPQNVRSYAGYYLYGDGSVPDYDEAIIDYLKEIEKEGGRPC